MSAGRVKIEMILTINVESKTLMEQVNKMVSKLLYFDRILIRLIRDSVKISLIISKCEMIVLILAILQLPGCAFSTKDWLIMDWKINNFY